MARRRDQGSFVPVDSVGWTGFVECVFTLWMATAHLMGVFCGQRKCLKEEGGGIRSLYPNFYIK